jgi:hypothetical protein
MPDEAFKAATERVFRKNVGRFGVGRFGVRLSHLDYLFQPSGTFPRSCKIIKIEKPDPFTLALIEADVGR